jgi:hypothetical protein
MDVNRIIKIEELEVGDEILTPSGSRLMYYRILRKPRKNPKTNRWVGVKCSMNMNEEKKLLYAGTSHQRTKNFTVYYCTPEEHNCNKSIYGLNYRTMWLVKRGDI